MAYFGIGLFRHVEQPPPKFRSRITSMMSQFELQAGTNASSSGKRTTLSGSFGSVRAIT